MRFALPPSSWSICSRFSIPGPPLGIFEKSSRPSDFWPSHSNAQWSVEIADRMSVRTDILSAISTDHCAFEWDGQKSLGRDDFSKIPNGGPGIENRLQMLHELGGRANRISLNRMVELLATNPAKLFGLYPRKGTIAVGSDADIVVFDPTKKVTISARSHHSKCDYNLFEGTEVNGSPEVVLLRGNVLVESG